MSCFSTRLVALLSLALLRTLAFELPGPYTIYKTEPTFIPSLINVSYVTPDRSLLDPGYNFIAPHIAMVGYGPQIVDSQGDLVWYGNPTVTHINGRSVYGMNFYVCDFMGQKMNHLCYSEGRPAGAEDEGIKEGGANRIFNNAYETVIDEFAEMGNLTQPNPHEFNVLPGGETFVTAIYPKRPMDLRPYNGIEDGWVWDGCIQEIAIHTRRVLFQWCYLDHHPIHETYLYLNIPENLNNVSSSTSGKGLERNAWDFMHLNSVDKNEEGDYLISGRHLSQLLKIAGPRSSSGKPPGTLLWRLGGRHTDFDVAEGARFARQHHARFISTGRNETVVSLFNNAFNNSDTIGDRSNAMILRINNQTMKAALDSVYMHPEPHLSYAQGSIQVLPSDRKNVLVGWGSYPEWSEFTRNGTLLFHAGTWAEMGDLKKKLTNYRAYKFPWIGKPNYPPKLVAYSHKCSDGPTVHVSWNGATEVGSWRLYMADTRLGPRWRAGTFKKKGFETRIELPMSRFPKTFVTWVFVEAIDKNDGSVLGMASTRTFVPDRTMEDKCDIDGCFEPSRFDYDPQFSRDCPVHAKNSQKPSRNRPPSHFAALSIHTLWVQLTILGLIFLAIESWTSIIRRSIHAIVHRRSSHRYVLLGSPSGLSLK